MALYRNVHVSFWNDTKVIDEMTPEDRYFMLYLLSNPHTNQVGCYEISVRDISKEMGYTEESIKKLLERFEKKLKVAKYSKKTKELLIMNWYKYNWTSSPKVKACIDKELKDLKNKDFIDYIHTVCIPYVYGMHTHTQEEKEEEKEKEEEQEEEESKNNNKYIVDIVDHLNKKTGKNFKANSKKTKSFINARLKEGFTVKDFKKVINIKTHEWKNDKKMEQYLRPETLFGNKFESYLNQNTGQEIEINNEEVDEYMEMSRRFDDVQS